MDANKNYEKTKYKDKTENVSFEGTVRGTAQRFGFLNVKNHDDVFIKPQEMDKVFSGDFVRINVLNYGLDNQNVFIEKIINSTFKKCVGVYTENDTGAYVLPDNYGFNRGIRIPKAYRKRAKNGDFVKVEIIEHPFKSKKPKARVVEVIGGKSNIGVENDYCLAKYNISTKLTLEMKEESKRLISKYDINKIANKRKNLSKLNFITIDGDNTVDIDDAIYVQKLKDKWKVLVAISDVSEFIKEDSILDIESYNRVSTVYLVGKTIPMLPSEFAHDYLSLKPNEKKAVLVADMTLSLTGKIEKYEFYEAIIESKSKFTYNEIESYLETGILDEKHLHHQTEIDNIIDIQKVLKEFRKTENVLPVKREDYRYLLDNNRKIEKIESLEQKRSYKVVEEIMLIANQCAASFLDINYEKSIFKTQMGFNEYRKKEIALYLSDFVSFEKSMLESLEGFKQLSSLIENHSEADKLKTYLDLNMKDSTLSAVLKPHYKMGFDKYTFFTSPIRRYIDILVHRMIKAKLHNRKYKISKNDYINHFSKKENLINKCVEEVKRWMEAEYLHKNRDSIFKAYVIGKGKYGLHIKIVSNGIKGYVLDSNDISNFDIMDQVDVKFSNVVKVGMLGFNLE